MRNQDNHSTDHLDDAQLMAKELTQHEEFRRLEEAAPQHRDTTYGVTRGSRALVESWERWWDTNFAARMRGLVNRPRK